MGHGCRGDDAFFQMIGFFNRLIGRGEPVLSEATRRDASRIAALHARSFHRGWSDGEFDQLLSDRQVVAHRAVTGRTLAGFIVSRIAVDEAEILSVAVDGARRSRGIGGQLLSLHLRRLAGFGVRTVFLEVGEDNAPARRLYERAGFTEVARRDGYYRGGASGGAAALVLRRGL